MFSVIYFFEITKFVTLTVLFFYFFIFTFVKYKIDFQKYIYYS